MTLAYQEIPGWYGEEDRRLFDAILSSQRSDPAGDLVEIGTFMGRSAVVIGAHLRDGERFVVIDLFGDLSLLDDSTDDERNRGENRRSYATLDRQRFEENYLAVHDELPVVVQAPSSEILEHVAAGAARFVHVDGSHLYPAVRTDCASTRTMLRPGGVAVFDDYRNSHCPGVAAAVWESVFADGLTPFATTDKKLYGCYGDTTDQLTTVRSMVADDPEWWVCQEHDVAGHPVLRLAARSEAAKARRKRAAARRATPSAPPAGRPRTARRVVVDDLAPPVLVRYLRRRRAR